MKIFYSNCANPEIRFHLPSVDSVKVASDEVFNKIRAMRKRKQHDVMVVLYMNEVDKFLSSSIESLDYKLQRPRQDKPNTRFDLLTFQIGPAYTFNKPAILKNIKRVL